MLRSLSALMLVFMIACGTAEHKFDTDTYEKAKESLEEKERKHPERFLSVTSMDKKNIIGQTVIKGTLLNRASVCTYKDVQLRISFFSKTGVLLEENKETVYEILPPNSSAKFKSKYFAPKGTDSIKITIIDARAEP